MSYPISALDLHWCLIYLVLSYPFICHGWWKRICRQSMMFQMTFHQDGIVDRTYWHRVDYDRELLWQPGHDGLQVSGQFGASSPFRSYFETWSHLLQWLYAVRCPWRVHWGYLLIQHAGVDSSRQLQQSQLPLDFQFFGSFYLVLECSARAAVIRAWWDQGSPISPSTWHHYLNWCSFSIPVLWGLPSQSPWPSSFLIHWPCHVFNVDRQQKLHCFSIE